jgi:hypothetical protein
VSALAAAAIVVVPAPGAARQEEGPEGVPPGWELTPGATIEQSTLRLEPDSAAFLPDPLPVAEVRLDLQYRGPGIVFVSYALTDGSRYNLIIHEAGALALERVADGAVTPLGESAGPVTSEDAPFGVEISVAGETHRISVDGTTVITAADPEPLGPGGIGLQAEGGRSLTVSGMSIGEGTTPPSDDDAGTAIPPEPEPTPAPTAPAAQEGTGEAGDGLGGLFEDFLGTTPGADVGEFAVNLGLAALLSFILSRAYVAWGLGLSNRRRFAANFMLITVTTTFIILVVRSSVALSLGLVGALSIVRFRAAIKDPEELAYLFLAIGIGIGLGDNQRLITILALAAAIVIIGLLRLFRRREADFNLHVAVAADGPFDLPAVTAALRRHVSRLRLSRYDEAPAGTEAAFLAEFRDDEDLHAAREAIQDAAPGARLTFLDSRGIG